MLSVVRNAMYLMFLFYILRAVLYELDLSDIGINNDIIELYHNLLSLV